MEFKGLEMLHAVIAKDVKCKSDCLVAAIHVLLTNKDLYCVGIGEEDKDGVERSELLPDGWNDVEDVYCMRYASNNNKYLLKIIKADDNEDAGKLFVDLSNVDTGEAAGMELDVSKHVSDNYKQFRDNYNDLDSLLKKFQSEIASKVKIGDDDPKERPEERPKRASVIADRMVGPLQGGSSTAPGFDPDAPRILPVGSRDLDPLGGMAGGIGGGMLMDPSSMGGRGPTLPELGIGGPFGLPRGSVPPGARFDPVGPVFPGMPGRVRPNPDNLERRPDPGDDN